MQREPGYKVSLLRGRGEKERETKKRNKWEGEKEGSQKLPLQKKYKGVGRGGWKEEIGSGQVLSLKIIGYRGDQAGQQITTLA